MESMESKQPTTSAKELAKNLARKSLESKESENDTVTINELSDTVLAVVSDNPKLNAEDLLLFAKKELDYEERYGIDDILEIIWERIYQVTEGELDYGMDHKYASELLSMGSHTHAILSEKIIDIATKKTDDALQDKARSIVARAIMHLKGEVVSNDPDVISLLGHIEECEECYGNFYSEFKDDIEQPETAEEMAQNYWGDVKHEHRLEEAFSTFCERVNELGHNEDSEDEKEQFVLGQNNLDDDNETFAPITINDANVDGDTLVINLEIADKYNGNIIWLRGPISDISKGYGFGNGYIFFNDGVCECELKIKLLMIERDFDFGSPRKISANEIKSLLLNGDYSLSIEEE